MSLTTEQRDAAKEMWGLGRSSGDIAMTLRVSRNAIVGLAYRGKWPHGPGQRKGENRRVSLPAPPREPKGRRGVRVNTPVVVAPPAPPPPPRADDAALLEEARREDRIGAPAAVLALRRDLCRWPAGDPLTDAFAFCAAATPEGKSYCAGHAALARGAR